MRRRWATGPWLNVGAVLGLVAVGVAAGLALARPSIRKAEAERDRTAAELFSARLEQQGRAAKVAEQTDSLEAVIARQDSALAEAIAAARAVPVARTVVRAELGGESLAPVDGGEAATGDTLTAHFADGPLVADLACEIPRDCTLRWQVALDVELTQVLIGRELVATARSADPRVQLEITEARYQLPDPEGAGWGWAEFGAGALTVAGAVWLAGRLR